MSRSDTYGKAHSERSWVELMTSNPALFTVGFMMVCVVVGLLLWAKRP